MKIVGRGYNATTKEVTEENLSRFNTIQFGEGLAAVRVSVRDGGVEVRTIEGFLVLEPRTSNVCIIRAVESM